MRWEKIRYHVDRPLCSGTIENDAFWQSTVIAVCIIYLLLKVPSALESSTCWTEDLRLENFELLLLFWVLPVQAAKRNSKWSITWCRGVHLFVALLTRKTELRLPCAQFRPFCPHAENRSSSLRGRNPQTRTYAAPASLPASQSAYIIYMPTGHLGSLGFWLPPAAPQHRSTAAPQHRRPASSAKQAQTREGRNKDGNKERKKEGKTLSLTLSLSIYHALTKSNKQSLTKSIFLYLANPENSWITKSHYHKHLSYRAFALLLACFALLCPALYSYLHHLHLSISNLYPCHPTTFFVPVQPIGSPFYLVNYR